MNAIMADIACGITLHYRELQKIKSHDKKICDRAAEEDSSRRL